MDNKLGRMSNEFQIFVNACRLNVNARSRIDEYDVFHRDRNIWKIDFRKGKLNLLKVQVRQRRTFTELKIRKTKNGTKRKWTISAIWCSIIAITYIGKSLSDASLNGNTIQYCDVVCTLLD